MSSPRRLAAALALGLVLLGGCASTILLRTRPPGARVYVDGTYLGRSPVRYTDTAPAGTRHRVDLALRGYPATTGTFSRDGPVNVGAACGSVCLVPALWIQDYPREKTFVLRRSGTGAPARGTASPGPPPPGDASVPPPYPGWRPASPPAAPAPAPLPPPPLVPAPASPGAGARARGVAPASPGT